MSKTIIATPAAPKAIGPYSQAVAHGKTVYLSGQIALDPKSMELVPGDCRAQTEQVFRNLAAVATAAGGTLADPARATVGVAALPRGALVKVDAVLVLGS